MVSDLNNIQVDSSNQNDGKLANNCIPTRAEVGRLIFEGSISLLSHKLIFNPRHHTIPLLSINYSTIFWIERKPHTPQSFRIIIVTRTFLVVRLTFLRSAADPEILLNAIQFKMSPAALSALPCIAKLEDSFPEDRARGLGSPTESNHSFGLRQSGSIPSHSGTMNYLDGFSDDEDEDILNAAIEDTHGLNENTELDSLGRPCIQSGKRLQGWETYNAKSEFKRLGVGSIAKGWRFSRINENYEFCPTYPRILITPTRISDNTLLYSKKFRSKGRIPSLSYIHRKNLVSITRSSQPLSGLKPNRSIQDEKLVEAIANSNLIDSKPVRISNKDVRCYIMDARPMANAYAQMAIGGGTESSDIYRGSKILHLGIDNIHAVRDGMTRMVEGLASNDQPASHNIIVERSGWPKYIKAILDGTLKIVDSLHNKGIHVLVHCSDGWDRTAQLSSLAQICLDPYYRTFEGFAVIIEKEWVSYGHKFQDRCGHICKDEENDVASAVSQQIKSLTSGFKSFFKGSALSNAMSSVGFDLWDQDTSEDCDYRTPQSNNSGPYNSSYESKIVYPTYDKAKEVSPVFTQFLDAVYQVWIQFPTQFEWNDELLRFLNDQVYSCEYGTFLLNNERERDLLKSKGGKSIRELCPSIWDAVEDNREHFTNKLYEISQYTKVQQNSEVANPLNNSPQLTNSSGIRASIYAGDNDIDNEAYLASIMGKMDPVWGVLYPSSQNIRSWVMVCARYIEEDIEIKDHKGEYEIDNHELNIPSRNISPILPPRDDLPIKHKENDSLTSKTLVDDNNSKGHRLDRQHEADSHHNNIISKQVITPVQTIEDPLGV